MQKINFSPQTRGHFLKLDLGHMTLAQAGTDSKKLDDQGADGGH